MSLQILGQHTNEKHTIDIQWIH